MHTRTHNEISLRIVHEPLHQIFFSLNLKIFEYRKNKPEEFTSGSCLTYAKATS
jgi:hypothetical protein